MFGGMEKQDEFVNSVCDNIMLNIKVDYIKFFYGDTSCVYTFKSDEPFDEVSKSITKILQNVKISYFLLPYSDFEINVRIDEETLEHLFGKELDEETPSINEEDLVEPQTFFSRLDEALTNLRDEDFDNDMDIDILPLLKKKKSVKTLDEILDQISKNGVNSLSEEDKQLLDKYSNQ
jgi:hypothetical protein